MKVVRHGLFHFVYLCDIVQAMKQHISTIIAIVVVDILELALNEPGKSQLGFPLASFALAFCFCMVHELAACS